ncbi:hypothetical protein N665_0765s0024 [Sinapis alba]|nr:hypothetical protein N665_0765s0024 [Sinapis alba]
MASPSETRSPLVEKDGADDDDVVRPIAEQEEPLERNSTEENDSEDEEEADASAVNPLFSDAAQILPLLQNLLLDNDIQRERLTGLIQLYAPTAHINALMNNEDEQIAREAYLSSQVHFLEQSVQQLEEEVENQKKLNAQLEEQIKSLTTSSDA